VTIPSSPSTPSAPHEPPTAPPPPSPIDRAFLTGDPNAGRLILVRHGHQQPPGNGAPLPSEWVDPPLSDIGRRQAEAVADALARERVDVVYCSSLRRARDTGEAIASRHGLEPTVLPELREVEIFRDLPPETRVQDLLSELVRRGMVERFVRERSWDAYPFSESSASFRSRILTVMEGVLAMSEGLHVVVACHGGVINAYLGYLLGVTEDMFFRPAHGSVHRLLVAGDRRVIDSLNETHHLSAVDPALVTC
jgi:probable phosphoglycerate mutase